MAAGQRVLIDASVLGFPRASTADILPGRYSVQAVLQPYELYRRGDGHDVWLPRVVINRVGGLLAGPGTLFGTPVVVDIIGERIDLRVSLVQPDVPFVGPANDTDYIKHVRMLSPRLSSFWGRPIYLEACVLLPLGWNEHETARYPMVVYQVRSSA
jgi:hypothetical protein